MAIAECGHRRVRRFNYGILPRESRVGGECVSVGCIGTWCVYAGAGGDEAGLSEEGVEVEEAN